MAWLSLAALLLGAPAMAQDASPKCPAEAEPVPAELSGWAARQPLKAVTMSGDAGRAALAAGTAYDLALAPIETVAFPDPPDKADLQGFGGVAGFTVAATGTYRVALGSPAWIDVVRDGKALVSVGHGHGPACSGIRKMVDFALEPGLYYVTVAGNETAAVPILVARLP